MSEKLTIELAASEDILPAKALYTARANWLKNKSVEQWLRSEQIHSIDYLKSQQQLSQFYVCKLKNQVVGSFCLQTKDEFWEDDDSSIYLNAFVSSIEHNGYGKFMIDKMIEICKAKRKKHLRLDCRADNEKLNKFYADNGFKIVG